MSGYNSRAIYDDCSFRQATSASMGSRHYAMFIGMHENPTNTKASFPCAHGQAAGGVCRACQHNKDATIENDMTSIGVRIDIESDLLTIRRQLGRCTNNKYLPCGIDPAACTNNVVVVPRLCERDIVPTNMVRPQNSGI